MNILFEDNHVLIVNKPAGIATQPSEKNQDSLETQVKGWLKEKYQKTGAVFLTPVHRIDKVVSGAVLFARSSKALSRLQESLRKQEMDKTYLALVEGKPPQAEEVLQHFLLHDDYRARIVESTTPEAKLAKLSYQLLESFEQSSLLEVKLETGRYHQIRAQLAYIGCPIIGDSKYQAHHCEYAAPHEISLHHSQLSFIHPTLKTQITVQAPLPDSPLWKHFLKNQQV